MQLYAHKRMFTQNCSYFKKGEFSSIIKELLYYNLNMFVISITYFYLIESCRFGTKLGQATWKIPKFRYNPAAHRHCCGNHWSNLGCIRVHQQREIWMSRFDSRCWLVLQKFFCTECRVFKRFQASLGILATFVWDSIS